MVVRDVLWVLSFSRSGADAMAIGGLMRNVDSTFAVVECVDLIFFMDFDDKV